MISKRRLSDKELAHRKRVQAGTSMAGSTAGLTSLGLLGGSVIARKKGLAVAPKLKNASTNAAITGAGIGGLSGFNFASIQNEEAKRRQPVSKMGEKIAALDDQVRGVGEALQALLSALPNLPDARTPVSGGYLLALLFEAAMRD